jgi:DNA gyrase/topoisomerase IV subunit A
VNGSSGIAVGMATNIPPHNLSEVINGALHVLRNPDCTIDELIELIPAPDFPTAGIIYGVSGVRDGYRTGRGRVVMRAKTHFEEYGKDGGRIAIIVDELPYQVNKKSLLERIAENVRDKKLEGISDIRDESDKSGMRVVIELKRGEVPEVVLNNLYKQTQLQDTFGMNMVALVNGQPKLLNLKQMLECFLSHRREVVTRRTVFELRKARERGHMLEGLAVALANIDDFIAIIKAAPTPPVAKTELMQRAWDSSLVREMLSRTETGAAGGIEAFRPEHLPKHYGMQPDGLYKLSDEQAQEILQMRLQRLTGLEQDKIVNEYKEVMAHIADLLDILSKPERVTTIIVDEMGQIKADYTENGKDARRSAIEHNASDLETEDLITPQDMVVTLSHTGYMKSQPISEYRAQKRGGRGKQAMATKDEDWIDQLFIANTHDYMLCFSEPRPDVLAEGVGSAAGFAQLARQADRQHVPAAGRREDHGDPAAVGRELELPGRPLRLHVDQPGHRQEDPAEGLQQPAQGRHHRGRPGRRRLPDRRRAHRRQARRDAVLGRRQGRALRRERRASDGPYRARRARHEPGRRPERDRAAGGRERAAVGAHRHRERLRQAYPDHGVHPPRPRHQGHDRDPDHRA